MRKIIIAVVVLTLTMWSCIFVWGESNNSAATWSGDSADSAVIEMTDDVQSAVDNIEGATEDMVKGIWEGLKAE